jgi:hypothetical protein
VSTDQQTTQLIYTHILLDANLTAYDTKTTNLTVSKTLPLTDTVTAVRAVCLFQQRTEWSINVTVGHTTK